MILKSPRALATIRGKVINRRDIIPLRKVMYRHELEGRSLNPGFGKSVKVHLDEHLAMELVH